MRAARPFGALRPPSRAAPAPPRSRSAHACVTARTAGVAGLNQRGPSTRRCCGGRGSTRSWAAPRPSCSAGRGAGMPHRAPAVDTAPGWALLLAATVARAAGVGCRACRGDAGHLPIRTLAPASRRQTVSHSPAAGSLMLRHRRPPGRTAPPKSRTVAIQLVYTLPGLLALAGPVQRARGQHALERQPQVAQMHSGHHAASTYKGPLNPEPPPVTCLPDASPGIAPRPAPVPGRPGRPGPLPAAPAAGHTQQKTFLARVAPAGPIGAATNSAGAASHQAPGPPLRSALQRRASKPVLSPQQSRSL